MIWETFALQCNNILSICDFFRFQPIKKISKRRSDMISFEDTIADITRLLDSGDIVEVDFNVKQDVDIIIDVHWLPLDNENDENVEKEMKNVCEEEGSFRVINGETLTGNRLVSCIEPFLVEKDMKPLTN